MDRTFSFSKTRKYNIPRVSLIYPQIQSGRSFFFPKPFVEFQFYKHSLSQFTGIFNALKLLFQFWAQSPLKTFEICSFAAPFILYRCFFSCFLLWTEMLPPLQFPSSLSIAFQPLTFSVQCVHVCVHVWERENQCVWVYISTLACFMLILITIAPNMYYKSKLKYKHSHAVTELHVLPMFIVL